MTDLIQFQLSLSTAEEEQNYFTGEQAAAADIDPSGVLPSGTYRIIDGELYQMINEPLDGRG